MDDYYYDRIISTIELTDKSINLEYYDEKYDIIPNHIIQLVICNSKNKYNNLPSSIKSLNITYKDKFKINNLPKSIQKFINDHGQRLFKHKICVNNLPNNIITIRIGTGNYKINNFPCSIKNLCLMRNINIFNRLPYNLEILYIYYDNEMKSCNNNLPKNIKKIILKNTDNSNNFGKIEIIDISSNKKINNLPHSIKNLSILEQHTNIIIIKLPLELLSFEFISSINHPVNNLPNKLKSLTISGKYIKHKFNQPLDLLPESLLYLKLELNFEYKHKINDLPSSIKQIITNTYGKSLINKMYKRKIIIED